MEVLEENITGTIFPCEMGDMEISWEPENHDQVRPIIEKKMKEGVTFFILKPVFGQVIKLRRKLKTIDELKAYNVKIKDSDIEKLFSEGNIAFVRTSGNLDGSGGRATTADEVLTNRTVGVRPLRGG